MILQQLSNEMAAMSADALASVVQITDGRGSIGAGTIWHPEGLVVTNAHVIAETPHRQRGPQRRIRLRNMHVVLQNGEQLPAKVLAIDRENDLAALAVDADDLPIITPGDSTQLRPGNYVIALGHPWGVKNALVGGVVIGSGAALPEMQPGREWIALDLKLRPGHSGGPLVNTDSHLIGINTMISGPSVGFAIPSHIVKRFLKQSLGEAPQQATPGRIMTI